MLIVAVIVAGICIGVLSACARVPKVRVLPVISADVLAALVAVGLFMVDSANLLAALAFVALTVVSSAAYSALLWSRQFAESAPGFGTLFRQELFRPGRVRGIYEAHAQSPSQFRGEI